MRVVIADDSVLIREGLAKILTEGGFEVAGQGANAEELLELVHSTDPDVAIVDIKMPPNFTDEGIRAAWSIRRERPAVGVLVLSEHLATSYAMKLLSEGTEHVGYLLKERVARIEQVTDAVTRVVAGESVIDSEIVRRLLGRARQEDKVGRLTPREREVLSEIAQGRSNKGICEALHLSPKTVATHVGSIFTKLDLPPGTDDHRRVLAVLTYLQGRGLAGSRDDSS